MCGGRRKSVRASKGLRAPVANLAFSIADKPVAQAELAPPPTISVVLLRIMAGAWLRPMRKREGALPDRHEYGHHG